MVVNGLLRCNFHLQPYCLQMEIGAIADYKYCFPDVMVKWPGSVHDSRIFCNSKVNEMLKEGAIPSLQRVLLPGTEPVGICIFGDPAYPLLPYLMRNSLMGASMHRKNFLGGDFVQ